MIFPSSTRFAPCNCLILSLFVLSSTCSKGTSSLYRALAAGSTGASSLVMVPSTLWRNCESCVLGVTTTGRAVLPWEDAIFREAIVSMRVEECQLEVQGPSLKTSRVERGRKRGDQRRQDWVRYNMLGQNRGGSGERRRVTLVGSFGHENGYIEGGVIALVCRNDSSLLIPGDRPDRLVTSSFKGLPFVGSSPQEPSEESRRARVMIFRRWR